MTRRYIHLGGIHSHKLFCLDANENIYHRRMAKLYIMKQLQNTIKLNILQTVNVILLNELGQISTELISVIDMFFSRFRRNNISFGGILLLCTVDHTQTLLDSGNPFLVSLHTLSCFQIVRLDNSVSAIGDHMFQGFQIISQVYSRKYE